MHIGFPSHRNWERVGPLQEPRVRSLGELQRSASARDWSYFVAIVMVLPKHVIDNDCQSAQLSEGVAHIPRQAEGHGLLAVCPGHKRARNREPRRSIDIRTLVVHPRQSIMVSNQINSGCILF